MTCIKVRHSFKMEGGSQGIIIVLSAFFIKFLVFGPAFSIGVLNIELLDYFDQATTSVSLIGAINLGAFMGSGPIVSFLMTKYSYRKISLFGSALVVIGLLGMPLLPYIPAMCLSFGVITGFGSSCVYIPSSVLNGLYYNRYRSVATGVATSGSGLSATVMPVVTSLLIEQFTWKGTYIILAGFCLHLFICSMFLVPPPSNFVTKNSTSGTSMCVEKEMNSNADCELLKLFSETELLESKQHLFPLHKYSQKLNQSPTCVDFYEKKIVTTKPTSDYNAYTTSNFDELVTKNLIDEEKISLTVVSKPGITNGVLKTSNTKHIRLKPQQGIGHLANNMNEDKQSHHLFIFTSIPFDVFFLNNILWNAGIAVILNFCPEFLRQGGVSSRTAAWMMGLYGVGTLFGGIFGGVVGNIKCINRVILYTIANFSMGFIFIALPNFENIPALLACLFCGGFNLGITIGLLVVVLTDLIGVDSLGNGMGYLMLSNGFGMFIGSPLAGLLRDPYGLKAGIILAGIFCIIGGFIMLILPCSRSFRFCVKESSVSKVCEKG